MYGQRLAFYGLLCAMALAVTGTPASAQGLIWSLPADGSWVRYEGKYSYIERREDSPVKDIAPWTKHITIQSVGKEKRDINGKMTDCRWIEIIVATGRDSEEGLATGPLGTWKYRVLIPEPAVVGDLVADGIPVSMLPVVEGYRKLGSFPVEPLKSSVLQVYPVISLLEHYRQWDGEAAPPADAGVQLGDTAIQASKRMAKLVVESPQFRSTNTGELWFSKDVPFGLAKWKVTVLREEKDSVKPRTEFQAASELIEEMTARATGTDAKPDPDFAAAN